MNPVTTSPATPTKSPIVSAESMIDIKDTAMNPIDISTITATKLAVGDLMRSGDHVILKLPSDNEKIIQLKPNTTINLGKFGKFNTSLLLAQSYGRFEITNNKLLKVHYSLNAFDINSESTNNNKNTLDDSQKQKLSQAQIEGMKGGMSGDSIVKQLTINNESFDEKTEYSKAKYIKRKLSKFSKSFTVLPCNSRNLCEYYESKDLIKIREMRIDTLSQILSLSNVRSGSRVLCVDDTGGLLACAIMERMGSKGDLVFVHDGQNASLEMVKFCGYGWDGVITYPFSKLISKQELVMNELHGSAGGDIGSDTVNQEHNLRLKTRFERLKAQDTLVKAGNFDTLIIASKFNPLEILGHLSPLLLPSSQITIHSPIKDLLIPTYAMARSSKSYIHVTMTESWMREYQVPVFGFGTHPLMSQRGNSGFLLNFTTCLDVGDGVLIETVKDVKRPKVGAALVK